MTVRIPSRRADRAYECVDAIRAVRNAFSIMCSVSMSYTALSFHGGQTVSSSKRVRVTQTARIMSPGLTTNGIFAKKIMYGCGADAISFMLLSYSFPK